jgi:hypothetical protein
MPVTPPLTSRTSGAVHPLAAPGPDPRVCAAARRRCEGHLALRFELAPARRALAAGSGHRQPGQLLPAAPFPCPREAAGAPKRTAR